MFLVVDRYEFSDWLNEQLNTRGWSQSDLARASGLHRAVISKIINKTSRPMPETLEAIARGLKVSADVVFQAAGVLPTKPDDDPLTREAEYLLSQLPEDKKQQAINFIRFLAGEGESNVAPRRLEKPGPGAP